MVSGKAALEITLKNAFHNSFTTAINVKIYLIHIHAVTIEVHNVLTFTLA